MARQSICLCILLVITVYETAAGCHSKGVLLPSFPGVRDNIDVNRLSHLVPWKSPPQSFNHQGSLGVIWAGL